MIFFIPKVLSTTVFSAHAVLKRLENALQNHQNLVGRLAASSTKQVKYHNDRSKVILCISK